MGMCIVRGVSPPPKCNLQPSSNRSFWSAAAQQKSSSTLHDITMQQIGWASPFTFLLFSFYSSCAMAASISSDLTLSFRKISQVIVCPGMLGSFTASFEPE